MASSRFSARSLLAAAFAISLGACGPRIPEIVKIGLAQPLSGPSAARGQDLVNGARLAAADLNAAGYKIAGKPVRIEIVAMDDKDDVEEAKRVAHALIEQKVTAVIGDLTTDATAASIPLYSTAGIPQLFTSTAVELTGLGQGNAFRLLASNALQARAIASYASDTLRARKVAILSEKTAFGTPLAKDIATGLAERGKEVALNESVATKTLDFSDFIRKLKAARPDVFVAVVKDNQLLPLLDQMVAAGLADMPVITSHVAKTDKVQAAPASVRALYVTSSFAEPGEFKGGTPFLERFRASYKSDPVFAAHYAYDAVYVIADTLRRNGSVDQAELRAKLKTLDATAPVTVTMRFNAAGEQRYAAVSVYQKVASKWEALTRTDRW